MIYLQFVNIGCLVKTQTLNYSLNSNINLYLIITKDTYDSLGLLLPEVVRIIDYFWQFNNFKSTRFMTFNAACQCQEYCKDKQAISRPS